MEREEIRKKLYELMGELLEIAPEEINEKSSLMDELDISSMEIMTMIADLEAHFQIEIPEHKIRGMITVEDMIDYIYEAKKTC